MRCYAAIYYTLAYYYTSRVGSTNEGGCQMQTRVSILVLLARLTNF